MSERPVLMRLERDGEIATIVLDNPKKLNAWSWESARQVSALADEIRFEIARQLLEDSAMEVSQIALFLSYSNASAFTRAFRRWSSTTPARWRNVAQKQV